MVKIAIFYFIFLVLVCIVCGYLGKLSYNRTKQKIKDEIKEEIQDSNFDICQNCYYKKRCEELEKEANSDTPTRQ